MELTAALTTYVLFCLFVFAVSRGAMKLAQERAGPLLLALQPSRAARAWAYFRVGALATATTYLLVDSFYLIDGMLLMYLLILGGLSFRLATAAGTQIRQAGIVAPKGTAAIVIPWKRIRYCRWMKPPGTLLIQAIRDDRTCRIRPDQIEAATEVLGRHVEVRDAASNVIAQRPPGAPDGEGEVERFRMQFTIRTMLLLMLVVSAGSSWYGIRWRRRQAEQAVVAGLERFTPSVDYKSGGEDLRGLDFMRSAVKPGDDDLVALKDLGRLKSLNLSGAPITDAGLAHLRELDRLESLVLTGTQITDAGLVHLRDMRRLDWLDLEKTQVTDAGLKHIEHLTELKILDLSFTAVSDVGMVHVEQLPNLETLWLYDTNVSDEQAQRLRKVLPGLVIFRQESPPTTTRRTPD